jgi:Sigma-70, region 4/Glyoxalase/Bleomycin resistance protein/Dioxygenase superfamily
VRHKLADHWRRSAREERGIAAVAVLAEEAGDPWDEHLDAQVTHAALARLAGPQRAALTLRYLDGLPVAEVAACLGRSVHATETLLVRARAALRRIYRRRATGMPDSLDALRLPVVPVEPRPEFAATLLRRIAGAGERAADQAATVRYFVTDLDAAVAFYRDLLGFEEELRPSPVFAMLYRGDLRLLLNVPGRADGGAAVTSCQHPAMARKLSVNPASLTGPVVPTHERAQ